MSELSYIAENVLVSDCKVNARTKLKKNCTLHIALRCGIVFGYTSL